MCLRKLAAILLLGMLFFNWVGFRLLNVFLENGASRRLEARLDQQQYDESQLISFKIPVSHLPYYNPSNTFQRTSGEVEVNGIPYHYVASRIFNDSLEMRCIPDAATLKLRHSNTAYFKLVNGLGHGCGHTHRAKVFTGDPFTCIEPVGMDILPGQAISSCYHLFTSSSSSLPLPTDERPPIGWAA